ncbi:universal stress protein [Massilia sp. BSC265]|uniref:universal stress protein n=1 Tax=Massilia sp. BSC265 TaxID=1549812 RepID=UPI0004E93002|nr:universal stress protein [Massilia sp. BSC265]KFI08506.1 hypothetical protein JN27_03900 [Massilia sp. BSC265]
MSLKTIVVHIDGTDRCSTRVALAAQLALAYDAHLIGVAPTGWSPPVVMPGVSEPIVPAIPVDTGPARKQCMAALAAFEAQARRLGVQTVETRLVEEEPGLALAQHGLCSDLVVVGQTRGGGNAPAAWQDFPEWVMLNSPVPVLVVPARGEFATVGTRVAVAWNGSSEARRAIGTALPVLRKADKVHLVMVDADRKLIEADAGPGADMGLYLMRHGVNVEVDVDITGGDTGAALVGASVDCGADLVVMGAYGRSRLREMLMGGATRAMLESMRVPVWMAH